MTSSKIESEAKCIKEANKKNTESIDHNQALYEHRIITNRSIFTRQQVSSTRNITSTHTIHTAQTIILGVFCLLVGKLGQSELETVL